jgi:hypothetical protein
MIPLVAALEIKRIKSSVNLRGRKLGKAQHFRHVLHRRVVFYKIGGKRMAQTGTSNLSNPAKRHQKPEARGQENSILTKRS